MTKLRAPFYYFGGKSRAASQVWEALGNPDHYIEPFCGSAAVLLARPNKDRLETINDADGMVANFWRASRLKPEEVAHHLDWPISECVPAGTKISTPSGDVNVEDIIPGMVVWGEKEGQIVRTVIQATKVSSSQEFIRVGSLRLTPNHPVWTKNRSYVESGSLWGGDTVLLLGEDGSLIYHETERMGGVRSRGPTYRSCQIRGGDLSRYKVKTKRTSFQGQERWEYPPGQVDSTVDVYGPPTRSEGSGRGVSRQMAGAGKMVDRFSFESRQPYGRGGRYSRNGSFVGDPKKMVRNEKGSTLCPRTYTSNERKNPHPRSESQNRIGWKGKNFATGRAEENLRGKEREEPKPGAYRENGCFQEGGQTLLSLTRENELLLQRKKARPVFGYARNFRVHHLSSKTSRCDRGIGLSGSPKRVSLSRETLPIFVPVYNFQTCTGNYFADRILVHNCDLHARHQWLIDNRDGIVEKLLADPEWCDPKVAGWWCWGQNSWIGDGWMSKPSRQLPSLSDLRRGIVGRDPASQVEHIVSLSKRLSRVRVCCGDWKRVCGSRTTLFPSDHTLHGNSTVGIFLDPPYATGNQQYAMGGTGTNLSAQVREWCIDQGANPRIRIVLAGLPGEHTEIESHGWTLHHWKAKGGYANQSDHAPGEGARLESLWYSPHCVNNKTNVLEMF